MAVAFAGPGVTGAIRNQFNLVGNTVENGTEGGESGGAGGGSTGGGSAAVQAAVAKDAKDWTLDEQKAVAEDIAAKGEASPAWAKAKAAMDVGTKFSMKLMNGQTLTYRIIGMNHDNLSDGSGKAGLTFLTTSTGISSRMNATNSNVGGWEKSELRRRMNSGSIWNMMPSDFQSKVKPVTKLTNNDSGKSAANTVTATSDKLFLLSYSEIVEKPSSSLSKYPWLGKEGTQYEAFKGKVTNNTSDNSCLVNGVEWWERSACWADDVFFFGVSSSGDPSCGEFTSFSYCVCPAWCF